MNKKGLIAVAEDSAIYISVKQVVQEFFLPYCRISETEAAFDYLDGENVIATEYWNSQGLKVPCTSGLWIAGDSFFPPRDLFVAACAADLLCFCHFYPKWSSIEGRTVFVSIGTGINISGLHTIQKMFPRAKIHLLLDADLIGKAADVRIATMLGEKTVKLEVDGDQVRCKYQNRTYSIPVDGFSLHRFMKVSGFRTTVRTHKPRYSCISFYNQFIASNQL